MPPPSGELRARPLEDTLRALGSPPRPSSTLTSRTATLARYDAPDGPFMVKFFSDGGPEDAFIPYLLAKACEEWAAARGVRLVVPRTHSWGVSPLYLCMECIEGDSLRNRLEKEDRSESLAALMMSAGYALGSFHAATTALIHDDLRALPVRQPRTSVSLFVARSRSKVGVAPTVGDLGPHNMLVSQSGEIYLIDLPTKIELRAVHWDLARLADRVTRRLRISKTRGSNRFSRFEVLRSALEGYEAATGYAFGSRLDTQLLRAYSRRERLLSRYIRSRRLATQRIGAIRRFTSTR